MATDHRLRRTHRLSGRDAFSRVFDAGVRQARGPLALHAVGNDLGHNRLGIAIGRRTGTAVKRNRIKRLIREAFRLTQNDLPPGYDLVVLVRPHAPLTLGEYQRLLSALTRRVHAAWKDAR